MDAVQPCTILCTNVQDRRPNARTIVAHEIQCERVPIESTATYREIVPVNRLAKMERSTRYCMDQHVEA